MATWSLGWHSHHSITPLVIALVTVLFTLNEVLSAVISMDNAIFWQKTRLMSYLPREQILH